MDVKKGSGEKDEDVELEERLEKGTKKERRLEEVRKKGDIRVK